MRCSNSERRVGEQTKEMGWEEGRDEGLLQAHGATKWNAWAGQKDYPDEASWPAVLGDLTASHWTANEGSVA